MIFMKRQLPAIVALTMLLPHIAYAAVALRADDSVAGLGTDIAVLGAEQRAEFTVVITPPLGVEMALPVQTDDEGNATFQLKGRDTEIAGMYRVSLGQEGTDLRISTTFEVLPDSISPLTSSIQLSSDVLMPTGTDTVDIVVILRDQFGNPLPSRPLKLISSRAGDRISSLQSETDEGGIQNFSLSTREEGTIFLRAIDLLSGTLIDAEAAVYAGTLGRAVGGPQSATAGNRQLYGAQNGNNFAANVLGRNLYGQVTTQFGLVDHFEITAPAELEVNEDATIRITAVDRNGNRVEDYTGTVYLSSTDPLAFLPVSGEVPFEPRNLGEKVLTLGLRFRTADEHILYAEDSQNSDISGQAYVTVTGGDSTTGGAKKILVSSPTAGSTVNIPQVTVAGTSEPFVNLIVTGGRGDAEGDTDINGAFSIPVPLRTDQTEHVLRVKDKDGLGRLDSGEFTIYLDNQPPAIIDATFSPEKPVENTNVLLVVHTEENIVEITAQFAGAPTPLESVPDQPGTYQHLFTAPAAGIHQVLVSVADSAGNSAQHTMSLEVDQKGLPKVQNIQALSEINAVTLQWDPIVSEKIDAYRIYVGESPMQFDFSLDTEMLTTAAQVAGLRPGTEYFFSVTALETNRESAEFDIVSAMVKGIRLAVTPQDASLLIDWSTLATETPLSSFILEYGAEPEKFTEKRFLNSELRNYTLRNLINEVKYYLKLTPVDVTGQIIEDLSATAEGTPNGQGFSITPGDEVPFDTTIRTITHTTTATVAPPDAHRSAPHTAATGLPTIAWWALAGSAAAGLMFFWNRRRKLHATTAFLQAMESHYNRT